MLALACLAVLSACNNYNNVLPAPGNRSSYSIETPYAVLRAPAEFETEVKTEVVSETPYVLSFKTLDGADLFSVHFDDETDNLLGTLELEDKNVVLYASFADLDKNDGRYTELARFQLGISTIIENLVSDYGFVPNEITEASDADSFDIETGVVTLKYPAVWKDRVTVDVTDNKAAFSCGGTKLFDLLFSENGGYLLGTYDGMPVSVVTYDIDAEGRTEAELQELYAMQQNVNYIIARLTEDSRFVMAE